MPRSQFVPPSSPPGSVIPLIRFFTVVAPAAVDTEVSARVAFDAPAAGATEAKVKVDTCDGVPVRASTKPALAAFIWTSWAAVTEFDRSCTIATLMPHLAGNVGLFRELCQMPPEASLLVLPVEIMKSALEAYTVPLRSWVAVWNRY